MQIIIASILGLATAAYILIPLSPRTPVHEYDWDGSEREKRRDDKRAAIEADVVRYRDALRDGTLCSRCAQANPPGSRFCMDCGRPLATATTSETPAEPVSR